MTDPSPDRRTADAFASSWLHLPEGSVYTSDQFEDWMAPLAEADFRGARVLELGCGNGSLLVHAARWNPAILRGVDLGESTSAARRNLGRTGFARFEIEQADLITYRGDGFDLVYCIGVLHHLQSPADGFRSVVANVRPGGRFHCWVYGREGNRLVRLLVEPLRRVFSRFPWWFTKHVVAAPLSVPLFLYAKAVAMLASVAPVVTRLPLAEYALWISRRNWDFFRHVVFDQLVSPTTHYLSRGEIEAWLSSVPELVPGSSYLVRRNGNSWKFGGRIADPRLVARGESG